MIYILIPILIIPQLLFSGILVQFDKLNPVFSSKSHVPWIGNVMASRWAYEALAVTQFKGNEYEKHFFEYNKEMKFSNWKKDKWVSNLDAKLESIHSFVNSEKKDPDKKISIERTIHILKNEIEKENRHAEKIKVTDETLRDLSLNKFSDEVYGEIKKYLATVKEYYKRKYKAFENKKDSVEKTFMKPSVEYIAVLDNAKIEDDVILAAGALVPPNKTLESGFLYVGSPAKAKRPLTEEEFAFLKRSAMHYVNLKNEYIEENS